MKSKSSLSAKVKRSNVFLEDNVFYSIGIEPALLLKPLVKDSNLAWFSSPLIHGDKAGDYHIVIGVDKFSVSGSNQEWMSDRGPINNSIESNSQIVEYILSTEIAEKYGIDLFKPLTLADFQYFNPPIAYYIYYSEPLCLIWPPRVRTLELLIDQVLDSHRIYLQKDIKWGVVGSQLIDILRRRTVVILESNPSGIFQQTGIKVKTFKKDYKNLSWIIKFFFGIFQHGSILFDEGTARLKFGDGNII